MNTDNAVANAFSRAICNRENFDDAGTCNWNFVDADIHMELGNYIDSVPNYAEMFDYMAGLFTNGYKISSY